MKRTSHNKIYDEFADLDVPAKKKYLLRYPDRARNSNKLSMSKRPKEYQRDKHLKSRFGITYDEFYDKLIAQNSKCFICCLPLTPFGKLSEVACVDHDHTTGIIRDLLCNKCNVALGNVNEKKEVLQNMIAYLDKWSK